MDSSCGTKGLYFEGSGSINMSYAFLPIAQNPAVSKKYQSSKFNACAVHTHAHAPNHSVLSTAHHVNMSSDNSTQNSERNDSYDVVGRLTSDQEAMQALSRAMLPALLEGLQQVSERNRGVPDEQVMPGVSPGNAARASQSRNQAVSNESGNEASNEGYEGHTWNDHWGAYYPHPYSHGHPSWYNPAAHYPPPPPPPWSSVMGSLPSTSRKRTREEQSSRPSEEDEDELLNTSVSAEERAELLTDSEGDDSDSSETAEPPAKKRFVPGEKILSLLVR